MDRRYRDQVCIFGTEEVIVLFWYFIDDGLWGILKKFLKL